MYTYIMYYMDVLAKWPHNIHTVMYASYEVLVHVHVMKFLATFIVQ